MASDREYQALLDKYNRLVAKYKDLDEQFTTKKRQWADKFSDLDKIESACRTLCEDILAKDKKEMVLGVEYAWGKVPTLELISKSRKSFVEYNTQRTDLMKHLVDSLDERRGEIESLKEQINILLTNAGSSTMTKEELEKRVEKEKRNEAELNKTNYDIKKNAEQGHIQVEAIKMENADGTSKTEEELISEAFQFDDSFMRPTPSSIPTKESKTNKDMKKKQREMMKTPKAHVIDLREHIGKMNPVSWDILNQIGTYGTSVYTEIESAILSDTSNNYTQSRIRTATYEMARAGILHNQTINLPLRPKVTLFSLSDIGQRLYKEKNDGKTAVVSEVERVIAEHDNVEHGYGIMDIANVLRSMEEFTDVCTDRKQNTIPLENKTKYIPDIVCKTEKHTHYVEYERGTHTQTDFNAKCNKMLNVTRYLNFVVPNKDILENVFLPKVKSWIKGRPKNSLNGVVIRINTANNVKNCSFSKNSDWNVVFMLSKSLEPVVKN